MREFMGGVESMKRRVNRSAILLLMFCLCATGHVPFLWAASSDTGQFTLDIPSMCKLVVLNANQNINLIEGAQGEAAYEAGYITGAINSPSLIVDSNTAWILSVAVSVNWNPVGSYRKRAEDLLLKVISSAGHQAGFSDYVPLSLTDQSIAVSSVGADNETYNCNYRIKLNWGKDIPGNYTIVLTYTLSTQAV
jgi:hypothetical protein